MILLVENNALEMDLLSKLLTDRGYHVRACMSGAVALSIMEEEVPEILITDIVMSPMSGEELLREVAVRSELRNMKVIVTTGLPEPLPILAVPVTVIHKPFSVDDLVSVIARLT